MQYLWLLTNWTDVEIVEWQACLFELFNYDNIEDD